MAEANADGTPPLTSSRAFVSRLEVRAISILIGALFFGFSLTPSLMPRDPIIQGVLGGLVGAIGYWIGHILVWIWRYAELPPLAQRIRLPMRALIIAGSILIAAYCVWRSADWQNAIRTLMGLEPVYQTAMLTIIGVAFGTFAIVWVFVVIFMLALRGVIKYLRRFLPRRVGNVIGFALVAWAFWALVDGALVRSLFRAADESFEAADRLIEPDVPMPGDTNKTGSAASLVRWDEMGRWGRSYVNRAPTKAAISAFAGVGAMEPIRVYVGRRSAETARERAEIALAELLRVGGFERSNLVVMVPVGTGWMDPGGHDTLEFMLSGDVTTVSVQYSYLTSALALMAHPEYGVEQARELFDVIYSHWTALPKNSRPKLYVHGLSQGAFNSQMTLPLLDMLGDPIQGALWAGSPFFSPLWSRIRNGRNPNSPAWRPEYGNGSLARVVNQNGAAHLRQGQWGPIRLIFLNYGSDAIVEYRLDTAYRPPGWLNEPRATDVSSQLIWFPVVTMFQLALDMAIALKVPGYGHYYIAPDYIDAWAAVVDPPGWNGERAVELKKLFALRAPAF